ncbi:hypothetical protein ACW0TQ_19340 [Oceanobacillus sp. M60]
MFTLQEGTILRLYLLWTILEWFFIALIARMSNKSYAGREKLRHDMNQGA